MRESPDDPAFTIALWDSASAGLVPPPPPWGDGDGGPHGAVRGHNDEHRKTVVDRGSRTITVADLSEHLAVVWAASAAELPGWWRAVPLRALLGWVLAGPGRHMVHAGAVGVEGRGVLLAGPGGAGKSTLAASCVEAGMDYVGDDYVLLRSGDPARAYAVYGTAKLNPRSLEIVPGLGPGRAYADEDKAVIDVAALRPARIRRSVSVEAVVLPRIAPGGRTELHPVPASVPFRALAVTTVFQGSDNAGAAMSLLGEVVESVPCYELRIGANPHRAPELLTALAAAPS
jgi:hypothetical protein